MTALPETPRRRPARRAAVVAVALCAALLVPLVGALPADAVASPQADAASTWLAAQVGPDGAVPDPFAGTPSVNWSVNVALSLATTGNQPDALARALGYVEANAEAYIDEGAGDLPGRLGNLLVLARAVDASPTAFGTPAIDLVARLQALYDAGTGAYGTPDAFSGTTNQALAVIGLVAAGAPVPAGAVAWLQDQQCEAGSPAGAAGGWEGYRAPSGGTLAPCTAPDPVSFSGPDTNNTALAVQALAAAGATGGVSEALGFLQSARVSGGTAAGGFGFYPGSDADPNSTAVVIQAIVAAGQSPSAAPWSGPDGDPLSSLQSWIVTSGADAGALASPFSAGFADTFATYQGVWGLAQAPFPLPSVTPTEPTTTTTTVTSTTTPDGGTGTGTGTGSAGTGSSGARRTGSVRPAFTG